MADALNAPMTASVQWFERTLDDSANRRISLPEGFLCCDSILRLADNVVSGLKVNEKIIEKSVDEYLPFIATENILMEAVKKGGDRQQVHEIIRRCSMEATARMKEGLPCDLAERLANEKQLGLSSEELKALLDAKKFTGRAEQQVEKYLAKIAPIISGAKIQSKEIDV